MSDELFSYRVQRFRAEKNLAQEELASILGVTARYIGMIEHGQKDVEPSSSLYKLFTLLEANKVPLPAELNKSKSVRVNRQQPSSEGETYPVRSSAHGLSMMDALNQVRSDLDNLEKGTPAERRRILTFMRDVHLPILVNAMKLD